jgi:hypothetical protein
MERQVRSAINVLLLFAICSCSSNPSAIAKQYFVNPAVNGMDLLHRNGYLLFRGRPLTGMFYELYPSGDTASVKMYSNGKENGLSLRYDLKGRIIEERLYVNGEKTGVHKGWFSNGRQRFLYHFKNDEYEGEAMEWFENGQVYRKFQYSKGQEDGRQQMWWPDGSIRANYVVKDGEQYGLIGRKLCVNPHYEKD